MALRGPCQNSPLLLSLATLEIAATEAGVDLLTTEHIVACLEAAGVSVKNTSVAKALARAAGRVATSKAESGETQYRLMTKGKSEVEDILGGELMSVVRVEGGRPRTARLTLGEMLSGLTGSVRICDPYYGAKTLNSLDYIPKTCSIEFLTAKTSESVTRLHGAVAEFIKERPKTEFRLAQKANELHDRYVLTPDTLLLLGHGLKDIGGKESFIIRLGYELVPDLIGELNNAFAARWAVATRIG